MHSGESFGEQSCRDDGNDGVIDSACNVYDEKEAFRFHVTGIREISVACGSVFDYLAVLARNFARACRVGNG